MDFGQNKPVPAAGAQPGSPANMIKDTTTAGFAKDVIEASKQVPVIVDFWAPWCGPCKTLGPMLEAAVMAAKGRVRMAKVNVDEAQMIAGQLRIQSIPTVYAFWQGQPVDGFQGALPASDVQKFVERAAALGGDGGLGEAIEAAEAMLAEGAAVDAAETFAAILGEEPENAAAYGGLVRSYLALGEVDRAQDFATIAPYTIEEAYEVADAIERGNMAGLRDELGDLLLQVVFHARMAEEAGHFAFAER